MPKLTDYELERQANIKRNKALLQAIGVYHAEVAPSREAEKAKAKAAAKEKEKENQTRSEAKRKPRLNTPAIPEGPRRKSARLSSTNANTMQRDMSSDPIDFLSHPGPSSPARPVPAVTLRRLPPPTIPERQEVDDDADANEEEEFDETRRAPPPTRDADGTLRFADTPHFTPNMTPLEMFRAGSFGGTAFAEHYSTVVKCTLPSTDYHEFPASWFEDLDASLYLTRPESMYDVTVNRYGVRAGQTLAEWERAGWVHTQDPRGWLQWYARFYLGRRSRDDERQIRRWLGVCGPSGRFKRGLVKKIAQKGAEWDDESVSPVLRQTLQHWAYRLTEEDYRAYL